MSVIPIILKKKKLGSGLNLSLNEPEVTAYIAGLATPLSAGEITLLNTLAVDIKTGLNINAISEAFDLFNVRSGETAEVSLKNFAKNAHHSTAVNSPTFTQYQGFSFNGTSQYLRLNYNPSSDAVVLGLDNASIIVMQRAADGNTNPLQFGAGQAGGNQLVVSVTNNTYWSINDATLSQTTQLSVGYNTFTRLSIQSKKYYKNLGNAIEETTTSTEIPNLEMYEGAKNRTNILYGKNLIGFTAIGKGLTQSEVAVVINAIEKYNDAHGKGVIA